MKWTVGKKLMAGFATLLFVLVIVAVFGIVTQSLTEGSVHFMSERSWPADDAVMQMQIAFLEKAYAHAMFIEGEIEEGKEAWREADGKFKEALEGLKKTGLVENSVITTLLGLNTQLNQASEGLISAYQSGGGGVKDISSMAKTEAIINSKAMEEFDGVVESMSPMFAQLEERIHDESHKARAAARRITAIGHTGLIGISFIGVILGVLLGFFTTRAIVRPVTVVSSRIKEIAQAAGDLTAKVEIVSNDELGDLAGSFNKLLESLAGIIKQIGEASMQIVAASNQILSASQQQASGAREQSSAVAETTSAARELSATSEHVGEIVKRVSVSAAHALAGMGKIKESINKTGSMITSLGEKSQKIGKITDLIDDVADQTNLLAVNASIEAARAGEQGKGFTVVADEIRKLSDSTAKSTKDITSLIELIQHEMTNSIMAMEASVKNVDEEARLAHETTERAKEIAMSATQQISGSKQIADAMTNIDDAMKQIATGAQQSQAAVKQLTGLAKELKETVGKFKIG